MRSEGGQRRERSEKGKVSERIEYGYYYDMDIIVIWILL